MKEYKVESMLIPMKISFKGSDLLERSTKEIQQKLDENAKEGWKLVSTDTFGDGVIYAYLYFERDKE